MDYNEKAKKIIDNSQNNVTNCVNQKEENQQCLVRATYSSNAICLDIANEQKQQVNSSYLNIKVLLYAHHLGEYA